MSQRLEFDTIHIIYNPQSTGDGPRLAKRLQHELRVAKIPQPVELLATQFAGHARQLAEAIAGNQRRPLLISVSGDGGYNEVVNGVMVASNRWAVCAVLPAGNAKDHSRTMQQRPLAQAIIDGRTRLIDLLRVTVSSQQLTHVQYAHSYAGLGLTSSIARALNKHNLTPPVEAWLTLWNFLRYRPFEIEHNGRAIRLDSLLFANINQMAKFLTLAPENHPDDGRFEIIKFTADKKWRLLYQILQRTSATPPAPQQAKTYRFTAVHKLPMQLDGEISTLPAGSKVTVSSAHKVLRTLY